MKTKSPSRNPRVFIGLVLCLVLSPAASALAQENSGIQFGQSYHNDVSPALRDLPVLWPPTAPKDGDEREIWNPDVPLLGHIDVPDPVIDHGVLGLLAPNAMPAPILNFDGIPFTG